MLSRALKLQPQIFPSNFPLQVIRLARREVPHMMHEHHAPCPCSTPRLSALVRSHRARGEQGEARLGPWGTPRKAAGEAKTGIKNWEGLFCPNHSEEKYVKGIVRYFCTD